MLNKCGFFMYICLIGKQQCLIDVVILFDHVCIFDQESTDIDRYDQHGLMICVV